MRNPLKRHPSHETKLTLRQRVAAVKATAARVMRRRPVDQSAALTLSSGSFVDQGPAVFPVNDALTQHSRQELPGTSSRDSAAASGAPMEHAMGRHETFENATPLADELLSGTTLGSLQRLDPVFAVIAETQRLHEARDAALDLPRDGAGIDPLPEQDAARKAFFDHLDGVLLKTVPTTGAGCAALCRYALEFEEANGWILDEDENNNQHLRILDLIARSPMAVDPSSQSAPMSALQQPASTTRSNRFTGPYVSLMRADGFVPFPAAAPTSMMAVAHAIPLEATYLLELAHAEYGRRCAAYHGGSADEVSAAAARLYRELRIGELSAIAREPHVHFADRDGDDAALADAVPNLVRIDIEIDASIRRGEADGPDGAEVTPAHAGLEAQRNALLARLKTMPAKGLLGLRAKAQALLLDRVQECDEEASDVGEALAADVLRLTADHRRVADIQGVQPDPVLGAIDASRKAEAEMALYVAMHQQPLTSWNKAKAQGALEDACFLAREKVWGSIPTSVEGRRALVAYARFQVALNTGQDGIVQAGAATDLLEEILKAFEAAVEV